MKKPTFYLTRQAARNLRDIHTRSEKQWGQNRADRYIAELYEAMQKVAAKPALGKTRLTRSMPFLMIPAGKHFIVYDQADIGTVIITLLHQRSDIEKLIANMEPRFFAEIQAIKSKIKR